LEFKLRNREAKVPVSSDSKASEQQAEKLLRGVGKAIAEHDLIADGDRIMVAVSGGKDSYTLLSLLRLLQKRAPIRFDLIAVNIDQGHPGYPGHLLTEYMAKEAYDFRMVAEDTYSIVKEKVPEGKTFCSLCSRLRRGILYRVAQELGCTKIALGHHREDVLNTLLLNMFFAGQIGAMPAKLVADEGRNTVIRPLVYCAEDEIRSYAELMQFPILPCNLCGSQENLKRKMVGTMLDELEASHPGLKHVMLGAVQNVHASHLLDRDLQRKLGERTAAGLDPVLDAQAIRQAAPKSVRQDDPQAGRRGLPVLAER
jgi:tRNA 2-thiocytidine biosynthesis protein TtcA